jgi:hypothetical protein
MRLFDAYMMHQRICRAVIQMCHSSVAVMLRDLCNKGGETSMDSPLETALIDGNFVSIRMQQGLSVSDWLCLRVKSSLLVGDHELLFRSATGRSLACRCQIPSRS